MNTCPTPDIVELQIARVTTRKHADGHTCHFQNCNIRNIPVEIHQLNGKYYIVCKFIRPVPGLHPQNTLVKKLYNFYCCTATGKIHLAMQNVRVTKSTAAKALKPVQSVECNLKVNR